jgi:hypothetical protein
MGKKYLLDTNTVIDYMGNKLPANAQKELAKIIDDNELSPKLRSVADLLHSLNCRYLL